MSAAPILYSFRRCPYAMRARLALMATGQLVRLREVVLRDKPAEMLEASPKGTVPVLVLEDGTVIDESIDVMKWSLDTADPLGWKEADVDTSKRLIERNDGPFKKALDRYKYPNRYEDEGVDKFEQRAIGAETLADLDQRIGENGGQLLGPKPSFADYAIFPFIRQFANTDRVWFDAQPLPHLQRWLAGHLESELFGSIMKKYPQWKTGDTEVEFGAT